MTKREVSLNLYRGRPSSLALLDDRLLDLICEEKLPQKKSGPKSREERLSDKRRSVPEHRLDKLEMHREGC